jgi:hypothetical protein
MALMIAPAVRQHQYHSPLEWQLSIAQASSSLDHLPDVQLAGLSHSPSLLRSPFLRSPQSLGLRWNRLGNGRGHSRRPFVRASASHWRWPRVCNSRAAAAALALAIADGSSAQEAQANTFFTPHASCLLAVQSTCKSESFQAVTIWQFIHQNQASEADLASCMM